MNWEQNTIGLTHREPSNESFKKWARDLTAMHWNQVIFSDETTIRLNCVKGLLSNLPDKKRSHKLSSIQSKSMFGIGSQVKTLVASPVLNEI